MEIEVSKLIEHLTKFHKPTDKLVVTWWGKDDVNLLLDENLSDSQAEEIWNEVSEEFGGNLDSAISAGNEYLLFLLNRINPTHEEY